MMKRLAGTSARLAERYSVWILLLFGLGMSFLPMWLSFLKMVPGDRGDGRLNLYFLEHSYQWLRGAPLHCGYWNAPFFFPVENTMAFSDVLLGIAPLYWLGRMAGMGEFTALQWLYVALSVLNFVAMYWLLRKIGKFSPAGAALGAMLFAFSPPRNYAMGHIQTLGTFYIPLLAGCLVSSFREETRGKSAAWLAGAALCGVGLFYAGFYIFFFTVLGGGFFVLAMFFLRECREKLWEYLKRNWPALLGGAVIAALLILPGVRHYRMAAEAFAADRPFAAIEFPGVATYLNTAGIFYKAALPGFMAKTVNARMGIGIITLLVCFYGMYKMGKKSGYLAALGIAGAALLIVSLVPPLWRVIFETVPGAQAVRVVPRAILFLLLVYAFAMAWIFDAVPRKFQLLIVLALLFEFAGVGYIKWDQRAEKARMRELSAFVEPNKRPLLLIDDKEKTPYHTDLDAMWLGLKTGRPAVNGYSGNQPPGYSERRKGVGLESDIEVILLR